MTEARWVQPKPRTGGFRRPLQQCQMPLEKMSPGASGWTNQVTGENWRQNYRSPRHVNRDPNFCFLDAHVEIDGKVYCTKHAGQIALALLLGDKD